MLGTPTLFTRAVPRTSNPPWKRWPSCGESMVNVTLLLTMMEGSSVAGQRLGYRDMRLGRLVGLHGRHRRARNPDKATVEHDIRGRLVRLAGDRTSDKPHQNVVAQPARRRSSERLGSLQLSSPRAP